MSRYHLSAIHKELFRVRASGEPAEIGDVYINALDNGLPEFKKLVADYGLTCKWLKTTGRYFVEKPFTSRSQA